VTAIFRFDESFVTRAWVKNYDQGVVAADMPAMRPRPPRGIRTKIKIEGGLALFQQRV